VEHVRDIGTTTNALGDLFFTSYVLPFEIASVILLVALIGAAVIARKDKSQNISSTSR
jgi:NADH:ubiquinone oxidoreductase subunit 6 (subunit J)